MRRVLGTLPALALVLAAACAHDERSVGGPPPSLASPPLAAPDVEPEPAASAYTLGDPLPGRPHLPFLALGTAGKGDAGVVLDGMRFVLGGAEGRRPGRLRAARDVTDPPLRGAAAIPARLGGGYVFRAERALYVSATFDGPLRPLATFPANVDRLSFGPRSVLARGENGERWSVDVRTGASIAPSPPGLVDVAATDDGRAAALTELGGAFVSVDGGEHWTDVGARLGGVATSVSAVEGAVWIGVAPSPSAPPRGVRLDPGGQLVTFDRSPVAAGSELRPHDPRWTGVEPPIRRAIRLGVPFDEQSALVVTEGSVARVDVRSGAVLEIAPGRLPPDATCEALRAPDDVLLACTRPNGTSFVASHLATDKAPVIEQSFAATGTFYAGDDGALAFGGPCSRARASSRVVCVRGPEGAWRELDLDAARGDAGVATRVDVVRWIPRLDGSAYGLVTSPKTGVLDARTGEMRPFDLDALPQAATGAFERPRWVRHDVVRVIDRAWTATPTGELRGWGNGATLDVSPDGAVHASPFAFEHLAPSGPLALAVANDGRVWQTVDRGATWVEVAAPLATRADPKAARPGRVIDARACSAVGCDLGAFYRVGWPADPPGASPLPTAAPPAPWVVDGRLPVVTCTVQGDARATSVARSERSPDDLGLGASRVPVADDNSDEEYVRLFHGRGVNNPPHGVSLASDSGDESPRVLLSGFAATSGDDHISVQGPNKSPLALKRRVTFVAPFDPAATLRSGTIAVSDVVARARSFGLGAVDVLQDDPTDVAGFAPVLTLDPSTPGDLLFANSMGVVGLVRANGRVRVTVRGAQQEEMTPISAVALPGDETAFLEVDSDGHERVRKWGPAGAVTDVFALPAPPAAIDYPADPDALAVGAHGDLAVVRVPSGGAPPTAEDPALLLVPGARPAPLAPWSTLVTADDPACKSDPGGFRAIVASARPWVQVSGPGFHGLDDAPSLLRVRWTASRVCLEALEARVDDAQVATRDKSGVGADARIATSEVAVQTWVVARFAASPAAQRQGIAAGVETRQALACTLGRSP